MRTRERGVALVSALVLLLAGMLLALSAGRMAVGLLVSVEHERDRAVARAAATAALHDAARDVDGAGGAARAAVMIAAGALVDGCGAGPVDRGLCKEADPPAWRVIDLAAAAPQAAPYGFATGAAMALGGAVLPARLPVYLVERLAAEDGLYRITAAGYGTRTATLVVLQARYRRAAPGRMAWREIPDWFELHARAGRADTGGER